MSLPSLPFRTAPSPQAMATWEPQEAICEADEAIPVILEPHKVGSSNKSGQWLISCLSEKVRVFLRLAGFLFRRWWVFWGIDFFRDARGSGERLKLLKTLDPMCVCVCVSLFLVSYNFSEKVTPQRPKTGRNIQLLLERWNPTFFPTNLRLADRYYCGSVGSAIASQLDLCTHQWRRRTKALWTKKWFGLGSPIYKPPFFEAIC